MADFQRNFIKGKMNKSVDERLVPNGEYIHAENVRLGSTEVSEIGAVENSRGNLKLTNISYGSRPLSVNAKVIGALEDGANEELYWFIHDPTFAPAQDGPLQTPTGILDLVDTSIFLLRKNVSRMKSLFSSLFLSPISKYLTIIHH